MSKPAQIAICHGPRCADYGGDQLKTDLASQGVKAEMLNCQSLCSNAPIVCRDGRVMHRATLEQLTEQT